MIKEQGTRREYFKWSASKSNYVTWHCFLELLNIDFVSCFLLGSLSFDPKILHVQSLLKKKNKKNVSLLVISSCTVI